MTIDAYLKRIINGARDHGQDLSAEALECHLANAKRLLEEAGLKIVPDNGGHLVQLTYFKPSGKYYSEGSYVSLKPDLHEIWEEVEQMNKNGGLPGLIASSKGWFILVDAVNHPNRHPHLIKPE